MVTQDNIMKMFANADAIRNANRRNTNEDKKSNVVNGFQRYEELFDDLQIGYMGNQASIVQVRGKYHGFVTMLEEVLPDEQKVFIQPMVEVYDKKLKESGLKRFSKLRVIGAIIYDELKIMGGGYGDVVFKLSSEELRSRKTLEKKAKVLPSEIAIDNAFQVALNGIGSTLVADDFDIGFDVMDNQTTKQRLYRIYEAVMKDKPRLAKLKGVSYATKVWLALLPALEKMASNKNNNGRYSWEKFTALEKYSKKYTKYIKLINSFTS